MAAAGRLGCGVSALIIALLAVLGWAAVVLIARALL
jgi:hypothetical protein